MEKKSINVKLAFRLKSSERDKLNKLVSKGKESARVYTRARILLLFDKGKTSPKISKVIGATAETVRRIGWNYYNHGLERALYDLPRSGAKPKISDKVKTHIAALACSDPPDGYSRWSIILLTEEIIKTKIVDNISRETVRLILSSHGIKPWREKNVVRTRAE